MTLKHQFRMFLRKKGIDLSRYNASQSPDARMLHMLSHNRIDLVIDVGANDGGFGAGLRDAGYEGAILSFEPLESVHRSLEKRAAAYTNWHIAPRMALGEEAGFAEINVAGNSFSSSLLPMLDSHLSAAPQSQYVGTQSVPLRRLDQVSHPILDRAKSIYLKIDTQGYEMPVLRGASALLPRVRGLELEMSLVPLYEGQTLYRGMLDWASGMGFELWDSVPDFLDEASGRILQMDGIFFRPQHGSTMTAEPLH